MVHGKVPSKRNVPQYSLHAAFQICRRYTLIFMQAVKKTCRLLSMDSSSVCHLIYQKAHKTFHGTLKANPVVSYQEKRTHFALFVLLQKRLVLFDVFLSHESSSHVALILSRNPILSGWLPATNPMLGEQVSRWEGRNWPSLVWIPWCLPPQGRAQMYPSSIKICPTTRARADHTQLGRHPAGRLKLLFLP